MFDSELNRIPEFDHPPQRVISLLPAITESLYALGFGGSLVGVSDFCIHPADKLQALTHIGKPCAPDILKIIALTPELVFASLDETPLDVVQELTDSGLRVWLSSPRTVDEALDVLRALLAIYHTDKPAIQINTLQMALDYARVAGQSQSKKRYFCPIWQGEQQGRTWWLSFHQNTYMSDLLNIAGGKNVFANKQQITLPKLEIEFKQAAGLMAGDERFVFVTAADVVAADPQVILLLDGPFMINLPQRQQVMDLLKQTSAVQQRKVFSLASSLILWPGVRLGRALQELPGLFE